MKHMVVLSNSGHYEDEYWTLEEKDISALIALTRKYGYLDAAPRTLVKAILKKGTKEKSLIVVTKYA